MQAHPRKLNLHLSCAHYFLLLLVSVFFPLCCSKLRLLCVVCMMRVFMYLFVCVLVLCCLMFLWACCELSSVIISQSCWVLVGGRIRLLVPVWGLRLSLLSLLVLISFNGKRDVITFITIQFIRWQCN